MSPKATASETPKQTVMCQAHSDKPSPAWALCRHVADQGVAPHVVRRLPDDYVAGEVVCADCYKSFVASDIVAACEQCVLERFKLQDAN